MRKIADIFVSEDGCGPYALALSGVDSQYFTIQNKMLFLKDGVTLNTSIKPSYTITVVLKDLANRFIPLTATHTINIVNCNEIIITPTTTTTTTTQDPNSTSTTTTPPPEDYVIISKSFNFGEDFIYPCAGKPFDIKTHINDNIFITFLYASNTGYGGYIKFIYELQSSIDAGQTWEYINLPCAIINNQKACYPISERKFGFPNQTSSLIFYHINKPGYNFIGSNTIYGGEFYKFYTYQNQNGDPRLFRIRSAVISSDNPNSYNGIFLTNFSAWYDLFYYYPDQIYDLEASKTGGSDITLSSAIIWNNISSEPTTCSYVIEFSLNDGPWTMITNKIGFVNCISLGNLDNMKLKSSYTVSVNSLTNLYTFNIKFRVTPVGFYWIGRSQISNTLYYSPST